MKQETRNYILAIRRAHNDYLPLDLCLLKLPNVSSLQAIDFFTKTLTREELIIDIIKNNIADSQEYFEDFTIIFKEKGRIRELPEGVCFIDDAPYVEPQTIIDFLYENYHDKILINKIYNYLNSKTSPEEASEIKFILNNLDKFASRGDKAVLLILEKLKNADYEVVRLIGMYIKKVLLPFLEKKDNIKLHKSTADYSAA